MRKADTKMTTEAATHNTVLLTSLSEHLGVGEGMVPIGGKYERCVVITLTDRNGKHHLYPLQTRDDVEKITEELLGFAADVWPKGGDDGNKSV